MIPLGPYEQGCAIYLNNSAQPFTTYQGGSASVFDPDNEYFTFRPPSQSASSYHYGVNAIVTKLNTGIYQVAPIVLWYSGVWKADIAGTSTINGILVTTRAEYQILVDPSDIYPTYP